MQINETGPDQADIARDLIEVTHTLLATPSPPLFALRKCQKRRFVIVFHCLNCKLKNDSVSNVPGVLEDPEWLERM